MGQSDYYRIHRHVTHSQGCSFVLFGSSIGSQNLTYTVKRMETKTVVKVLVSGVLLLAVGVAIFPIFDYVIHIELEKVCDQT